jgi:hypothetical protein
VPGMDIALLIVAVRQSDGWRISVGQIAHPPDRRETLCDNPRCLEKATKKTVESQELIQDLPYCFVPHACATILLPQGTTLGAAYRTGCPFLFFQRVIHSTVMRSAVTWPAICIITVFPLASN